MCNSIPKTYFATLIDYHIAVVSGALLLLSVISLGGARTKGQTICDHYLNRKLHLSTASLENIVFVQ